MTGFQCHNDCLDKGILAYQFNLVFFDLFYSPLITDMGIAAFQGTKLSCPERLPATAVIVTDFTGSRFKKCGSRWLPGTKKFNLYIRLA